MEPRSRHIVDATGLFRGNIYHYFKTKDEILEAVVEDIWMTIVGLTERVGTRKQRSQGAVYVPFVEHGGRSQRGAG